MSQRVNGVNFLCRIASKQRDLDGVKIFYGRDRQSWKRAAANFRYTKYTRYHGPRGLLGKTKNDGRPPDTASQSYLWRPHGTTRKAWSPDLVRVTKSELHVACWQTREGIQLCDGNASEQEVILNLPVVLIIEMGGTKAFHWGKVQHRGPHLLQHAGAAFHCALPVDLGFKEEDLRLQPAETRGRAIRLRTTIARGSLTDPPNRLKECPRDMLFTWCTQIRATEPAVGLNG
ncbi:hypothetical protein B0H13DRAFT_1880615 [Mycena leptocephala]|nr:hypothetical protein B0H13DRAFT_1880615 [Mycena leptocephala]